MARKEIRLSIVLCVLSFLFAVAFAALSYFYSEESFTLMEMLFVLPVILFYAIDKYKYQNYITLGNKSKKSWSKAALLYTLLVVLNVFFGGVIWASLTMLGGKDISSALSVGALALAEIFNIVWLFIAVKVRCDLLRQIKNDK